MRAIDILKKHKQYNEGLIKELYLLEQEQYRKLEKIKEQLKTFQSKKSELNKENKNLQEAIEKLEEETNEVQNWN